MNKLELNLPSSDWEVEYSRIDGPDEAPEFSCRSVRAKGKGTDNGIIIEVVRNDVEGDILMPEELLRSAMADELEALNAGIPEYYQMLWGDPVIECTFQGRQAAYLVEQRAGESSAILHAIVMDEAGWCSFVTVGAEDWTSIADPVSILSFLEEYLVL